MRILRSAVVVLALGAASISSALARDSFNIGINIGGYGYHQPVRYYAAPPVVYYHDPVVYYRAAPRVYHYGPVVSYGHGHRWHQPRHHGNRWNGRGNNGHRGHGKHRGHR